MKPIDILTSEWAIMPAKLAEIQAIYTTHLKGPKIDQSIIDRIEADMGRPLNNEQKPYQVIDNVALIEINGVIAKRMNLFSKISGGVSTQLLKRDFEQAFADPEVTGIILIVDSPGGTVDGTEDLANAVYAARQTGTKPIISFVDGLMASAAYWIGSAADRIYMSGVTAQVGSIGVVASHTDISKYEERQGIKTTEIYAGKYKRIASEYEPLSKEGRAYIQDRVDSYYSIFVNTVAKARPEKCQIPAEGGIPWAEGKVFIGQQAIDNGLADGISTLESLISRLSTGGTSMLLQEQILEETERRLRVHHG
ncbi:MAG: signal peptide peptidase SppA [Syntrophorhabdaceae bacterium]